MRIRSGVITIDKHGIADERRAWRPGSTIKPFTLASLLRRNLLNTRETFACPGQLTIRGRQFNCVHPRIGTPMNVTLALAYSCNCAVAHWAARFGHGELAASLQSFGFTISAADPTLLALGEDGVLISPEQLLRAYVRLASVHEVLTGLAGAVQFGTAQRVALPHLAVGGKTGSATTETGGRIAWFAGFAPLHAPEVAVCVLAAGGSGGADAAPIAHRLLANYFGPRA